MDRKAWIAITLSVIGLVAFEWYNIKTITAQQAAQPPAAATPAGTASPVPLASATPAPEAQPTPAVPAMIASTGTLSSADAEYVFSNDKGGIESVILKKHKGENGQGVVLNSAKAMPIGTIGQIPGEALGGFSLAIDETKGEAVFTRNDPNGLEITKRITLPDANNAKGIYALQMQIEFKNAGKAELKEPAYFVSTGGAAAIHPKDLPSYTHFNWMHERKFKYIDVNWFNASVVPLLNIQWNKAQSLYLEPKVGETLSQVAWAGVASQYFCSIVSENVANDQKASGVSVWAERYETKKMNDVAVFGIQGGLGEPEFTVPPEQTVTKSYTIYVGPKDLTQLRALKGGQDAVLNFGMFGFVSEFLLWAMNSLNSLFHTISPTWSYGWAIIVLTLCIKSALWPLQNRATNQMRRMSLLSPKMTEIREKYKDDPQKMNEETMKLYRDYGVNPITGCFPMLLQIPIFLGFYSMLGSAIQLRNSSFLWVHDLSQPDVLTTLDLPFLGHIPINLLPLVMAGTMVWQMAISPKSGDAMQQRMMYFMPIVFLAFAYNYASGLALYWTTQNIFSIVQLYLTRNRPLPTLEKKSAVAKREADASKKKKKRKPGL
ncbi:membrane protein insertase YidC [soil metagenome]